MTVASTDIQYRLSGGASNSSPVASLGGAKSTTQAGSGIFDNVSATEAGTGRTEYRCVYVHNAAADALANTVAWINFNTPSTTTEISIGLGSSAANGTEQEVVSETTAPDNVTFTVAANKAAGLNLGTLAAGQSRAIWLRRVVTAGTVPVASDRFTVIVEGETT